VSPTFQAKILRPRLETCFTFVKIFKNCGQQQTNKKENQISGLGLSQKKIE